MPSLHRLGRGLQGYLHFVTNNLGVGHLSERVISARFSASLQSSDYIIGRSEILEAGNLRSPNLHLFLLSTPRRIVSEGNLIFSNSFTFRDFFCISTFLIQRFDKNLISWNFPVF